jgi:hypothetical protein
VDGGAAVGGFGLLVECFVDKHLDAGLVGHSIHRIVHQDLLGVCWRDALSGEVRCLARWRMLASSQLKFMSVDLVVCSD